MSTKRTAIILAVLVLLVVGMIPLLMAPVTLGVGFGRGMMRVKGMTHHIETLGDFEVSYFEKGPDQKQTVILVHGLADQAGTWWQTIDVFTGYHVIAVELPGHGESGPPQGDIDIEMFRKSIEFVMKRSHGPVILVGNSLGGYVSLQYALEHPDQVMQIVAIDAAGMPMEIDPDVFMPKDREAMAKTMFKVTGPNTATIPGFVLDDIRESIMDGATPRVWKALRDGGPLDQDLGKIAVPTTVIWGDQDGLIPVSDGRAMAKIIPGANYIEIAGCGHSPQATCADELNPILSRILPKPN
jgi:pimeloyl-ACP methyl ester carboxylesterase